MTVPRDPHQPMLFEHWYFLRRDYRDTTRLDVAFRLAKDVETCAAILAGLAVARERLDPDGLTWAMEPSYVQLLAPIEAAGVEVIG